MKPIYIFGRKRIRELEDELRAKNSELHSHRKRIVRLKEHIKKMEEDFSKTKASNERLNLENRDLQHRVAVLNNMVESLKLQPRDAKGRFTKKKMI